jgi:hypothetical protein
MAASGSWLAFNEDKSELALFSAELNAFRHGNGRKFSVVFWPFGKTLDEVTAAPTEPVAEVELRLEPGTIVGGKPREM